MLLDNHTHARAHTNTTPEREKERGVGKARRDGIDLHAKYLPRVLTFLTFLPSILPEMTKENSCTGKTVTTAARNLTWDHARPGVADLRR